MTLDFLQGKISIDVCVELVFNFLIFVCFEHVELVSCAKQDGGLCDVFLVKQPESNRNPECNNKFFELH